MKRKKLRTKLSNIYNLRDKSKTKNTKKKVKPKINLRGQKYNFT